MGGAEGLSVQRCVNFSVIVPFGSVSVSFLWKVGVGLVGVVALCGGVDLVGEESKTVRMKGSSSGGGGIHRRERRRGTFSARLHWIHELKTRRS